VEPGNGTPDYAAWGEDVIPGLLSPDQVAQVTTQPWDQLAPFNFNQGAAIASAVVKAQPGALFGWSFTNTNAAARYLQFFDAVTVPADTAVPLISILVAIGASDVRSLIRPRVFLKGIVVCNSSTGATKTVGAADSIVDIQYV
jgi:hypothetical protein